jgi:hypothetical protein
VNAAPPAHTRSHCRTLEIFSEQQQLISKPLNADDLDAVLARWNAADAVAARADGERPA